MLLCTVPTANYSNRICKIVRFFVSFSSSCALRTIDFVEESSTHDCDYIKLQRRTQNYATSGHFRKALETLSSMRNAPGKPTVYDYNSLMYCYLRSRNVLLEELVEVYLGMKRFGPAPNALTFNVLLNGMLSLGNLKDMFFVANEMCGSGFVPSFTMLLKVLKKSLELGSLDCSLGVFRLMLRLEYFPTEPVLNLLISLLTKARMIREAYSVLSALLGKGYFCSVYSYNLILWALCKSGQSYAALELFCLMKKKGIVQNVCTYTALVYGFGREGLGVDLFRCLNIMQSDGFKPNLRTYTIIIKFLCDAGRVEEALEYLDRMEREGCDPDLITYNIILRELCHQDKVGKICELVQVIDQRGFSPNPYTYAALAGGMLKVGKIGMAHKILLDVIARGCTLDVAVYNIYFNCLCCDYRSREALSLLKSMMEDGFTPSIVCYNTILKGFCRENSIEEALELMDSFEWENKGPDVVSFNTILSAACKQGNSSLIQRILFRMEHEGVELNVVSSTCLIQYFCTVGKFSECLKLMEYMMRNGPTPTTIALNMLLDKLCKSGLLRSAHGIFEYLRNTACVPDTTSYNILIRAFRREGALVGREAINCSPAEGSDAREWAYSKYCNLQYPIEGNVPERIVELATPTSSEFPEKNKPLISMHEFFGQKWRALYQPPNKEIAAQLYVQNIMSSLAIPGFQTVDIGDIVTTTAIIIFSYLASFKLGRLMSLYPGNSWSQLRIMVYVCIPAWQVDAPRSTILMIRNAKSSVPFGICVSPLPNSWIEFAVEYLIVDMIIIQDCSPCAVSWLIAVCLFCCSCSGSPYAELLRHAWGEPLSIMASACS
ncbi:hypothetical protein FH972_013209 [Carpinus fangiana]|uniref:Uncharacterized protein n=1 Tax=Carpinus fangiana TaxID=176857 RepID=A0A5N6R987_9ROSI|nr:hypothetical protein FH972_013209 [Carpinus fangiana]